MIDLLKSKHKDDHLIRLIKRDAEDIWDLYIGNWLGNPEIDIYGIDFKPTKPISMKANDLLQLAKEIRIAVDEKPYKDDPYYSEKELNLTFYENEPKCKMKIRYQYPDSKKFHRVKSWDNKFQFSIGFNINYSVVKDTREENQYLYEDGGKNMAYNIHYTDDELLSFADDIEKEVKQYE